MEITKRTFLKKIFLLSFSIPIFKLIKKFYPKKKLYANKHLYYPGKIIPINYKSINKSSKWRG